jgi:Pyridoxamine 5'-phosphate oxidase
VVSWDVFEAAEPEMAAAGRRLLWVPGIGFGYLATVRPDGGPRIHPVNLVIADGRLLSFLVPSPKLHDLRRNGRYALHSTGSETESDEFYLTGTAAVREDDPPLRQAAAGTIGFTVADDHVLVELGLEAVLWAHYSTPPSFPPTYRRWRASAPGTSEPGER